MWEADQRYYLAQWPQHYRLVKAAQVNITNLIVRLQRLGLICPRDGNKKIYRNQDEVTGQRTLF